MDTKRWSVVSVAVLVMLVGACAKPPEQELAAAESALAAAEQAEAGEYAASELEQAKSVLDQAKQDIQAQGEKFALFRSYKDSTARIAEAQAAAQRAQDAAVAGKESARQEATAAMDALRTALDGAGAMMAELDACPRKPKGFKQDMDLMMGNLDGMKSEMAEIESLFSQEAYNDVKARAESLKADAETLMADLEGAKAKIGC